MTMAPTRGPSAQGAYGPHRPVVTQQIQSGAFKPALALLLTLAKHLPPEPDFLDDLATCYWRLGDHEAALKLAQLVAQDRPDSPAAWARIGAMALSSGDPQMARDAFERVLTLSPRHAGALGTLNRMEPFARKSRRAELLRKIAKSPKASRPDRITAYTALGRIEDHAGQTKAAFFNWSRGKALSEGVFDPDALHARVAAIETAQPAPPPDPGGESFPRMVFIVGLPRSGTTLLESILLRHPDVGSFGETPALQDVRAEVETQVGPWPQALSDSAALAAGRAYIDRCAARCAELSPVMVDKTPLNIFDLGFAARVLPEARFIFAARHPLDVGLSNFSTNYHAAHPFSKTLAGIAEMSTAVRRAALAHQTHLGASLRWQRYSALVSDPETQIRALLDHCGLDWCDACLHPETRKGAVATASLTQVRAQINTGALGKWQRYAAELTPLIEALGGPDAVEAWDAPPTA